MAGFPSLQPALTVQVEIGAPKSVGSATRNTPVNVVPMVGGTVKSEPGFTPAVDAVFDGIGNDYIHVDPDQKRMRLDAHGVLKDKTEGLVYLNYTGIVAVTEALGKILSGAPDAKDTDFGDSFVEMRFETGHEALSELENSTFVGAGRFLKQGDKTIVEYKVSKVVK